LSNSKLFRGFLLGETEENDKRLQLVEAH